MVFPTCVGVFLVCVRYGQSNNSLPHVRGGVSFFPKKACFFRKSSPRAWGCFSFVGHPQSWQRVFPTCVGVFLDAADDCAVLAPVFPTCVGVFLKTPPI